jgi:hypothetical protein
MRRYLDSNEANTYLNLGRTIEVFLGRIMEDKEVISYLTLLRKADGHIEMQLIDHYDEGNLEYTDIYDFSYVDPDMSFETINFGNLEQCKDFIRKRFHLDEIGFVNAGLCQEEYADLIKEEGST